MATVALVSIAGLGGCASPTSALGTHRATVTVNGDDTGGPYPVNCSQFGWNWKIETVGKPPGFTAMFATGDTPTAKSVVLRELGGFTGSYYQGTVGEADVDIANRTFTLRGTAVGYTAERPTNRTTARFTIKTDC